MQASGMLAGAIGKILPELLRLAKRGALRRQDVVAFLRNWGWTNKEDDFDVCYVHALAIRAHAGSREAVMRILADNAVIAGFRATWTSEDVSAFVEKVDWAVRSLRVGEEVERQGIDAGNEAIQFHQAFVQAWEEAQTPSHQMTVDTVQRMEGKVNEMYRDGKDAKEKLVVSREKTLDEYLVDVKAATSRIDIEGIGSAPGKGRTAMSFAIEEQYTPLTTMNPLSERHKARGVSSEDKTQSVSDPVLEPGERVPLTRLLATKRALLLVGDPGSGKSTFLRLIACVLAKDMLKETKDGRRDHLGLSSHEDPLTPILIGISALAAVVKGEDGAPCAGGEWRYLLKAMDAAFGEEAAAILSERLDRGQCALLLDGLDEEPDPRIRKEIVRVVNGILHHWSRNLIVVTSRPFGYREVSALEGMVTARIDDFGEDEIRSFLKGWAEAMYSEGEERSELHYLKRIQDAILTVPRIKRMARNPVMLTCLSVVHWNERQLPEGKADLLAAVLRWLLEAKDEKRRNRGDQSIFAEECFKALALALTVHPEGKQVSADVAWAAETMSVPFRDERNIGPEKIRGEGKRFLDAEMLDSGIVVEDGLGRVRFWHLTFQEHYAAKALSELPEDEHDANGWWQTIKPHLTDPQWEEVLDHFAGCLAGMGRRGLHELVGRILSMGDPDDLEACAKAVSVVGRLLEILEVYGYSPPSRLGWEEARERVMAIFTREGARKVPATLRIQAAEALRQGGDGPFRSMDPKMLPIPGNPKVLLGKYPVTVEEYKGFVDAGGYDNPGFWGEGRDEKEWDAPFHWEEQLEHRTRPIIGISWYEARAYCKWLANHTGKAYRLPSEKEWEAAATHPNGGYPWGNAEATEELMNFDDHVGHATPVGVYPEGAAPGAHLDMAGNVWEWMEDDWHEDYKGAPEKGEAWMHEPRGSSRVSRGGCWINSAPYCRSECRYALPGFRRDVLGFRLSRSVP